jgi:hypothetical protein
VKAIRGASLRNGLAALLSGALVCLSGFAAQAINIAEAPPATMPAQTGAPAMPTLRVTGMIEPGDADKLSAALRGIGALTPSKSGAPVATVELSSMGGSLPDGFEIGMLMRKSGVMAVVRQRDLCMSSCALAFLGGNVHAPFPVYPAECNLEIGGTVAFHNFFLNSNGLRESTSVDPVQSRLQGFSDARGGTAMLAKYAGDLGLPPDFVASLIGRPVESFQYVETVGQFLSFHVCAIGIGRPAIPIDMQARNICNNSIVSPSPAEELIATSIPVPQAKLYLLQRVQENMQSSKAKGRLAAQLVSGAVMRVKDEIDRLYEDLRAAGVALPDIVGPTFELGSKVSGTYEATCYVSLSSDDPDKYDIALQGPRGIAEPTRLPPENSRRLFLFDRNDVINPHR